MITIRKLLRVASAIHSDNHPPLHTIGLDSSMRPAAGKSLSNLLRRRRPTSTNTCGGMALSLTATTTFIVLAIANGANCNPLTTNPKCDIMFLVLNLCGPNPRNQHTVWRVICARLRP